MLSPGAAPTSTVSGPVLSLHAENTLEKPRSALEQVRSGGARNPVFSGLRMIASAHHRKEAKGRESQRVRLRSEVTTVWRREEVQHQAVRWLCSLLTG